MDVFDAAERYHQEGRQLIILAGKDYGSGSSRDWAAKGPWMQVHRAKLNPGFMDLQALFLDLCIVGLLSLTNCSFISVLFRVLERWYQRVLNEFIEAI